jgi:nucleotide-binding universal stress UspA family protein
MAKPVIVGVDPLQPDAAPVRVGAAVARLTGAPLIVAAGQLHDAISNAVSGGRTEHEAREEAEHVLASLSEGVDAERLVVAGFSGARALHELAAERDAGLLVVGSSRRGRVGRLTPGTTAERLLHGASCAVVVVPRGLAEGWELRSIGVGFVDLDEGRRALAAAAALAGLAEGRLEAVTAIEPMFPSRGAAIAPYDAGTGSEAALEVAERSIRNALRSFGRDTLEGKVVGAEPVEALTALSERVDLVVCGSRGYGPVQSVLMGSVSHGLIQESHAPVLVIPRGVEDAVQRLLPEGGTAAA